MQICLNYNFFKDNTEKQHFVGFSLAHIGCESGSAMDEIKCAYLACMQRELEVVQLEDNLEFFWHFEETRKLIFQFLSMKSTFLDCSCKLLSRVASAHHGLL